MGHYLAVALRAIDEAVSTTNIGDVEILSVNTVRRSMDNGFVADAFWTVSGSVSHFGHTHYRRNQYHAMVTFMMDEDSWKINDIEVIDEKRLL